MRIIYFCTAPQRGAHAGGVKVIYDHSCRLNAMGVESYVLHERQGYVYPWTSHRIQPLSERDLRTSDFLVIPEIKAAALAPRLVMQNLKYAVFVQNGYYLHERDGRLGDSDVDFAYRNASRILSISGDTSALIALHYPELAERIVEVSCVVGDEHFRACDRKDALITFMPRKNTSHAQAVAFALKRALPPGWKMQAIDGLPVAEVAAALRRSRIFLSFSGLEGLGLPPIEAALCGNYVIGYHGGGGLDYWRAPNFETVPVGDVATFVERVRARIAAIDADPASAELAQGIAALRAQYSAAHESTRLQQFVAAVAQDAMQGSGAPDRPVRGLRLQKRKKLRFNVPLTRLWPRR